MRIAAAKSLSRKVCSLCSRIYHPKASHIYFKGESFDSSFCSIIPIKHDKKALQASLMKIILLMIKQG